MQAAHPAPEILELELVEPPELVNLLLEMGHPFQELGHLVRGGDGNADGPTHHMMGARGQRPHRRAKGGRIIINPLRRIPVILDRGRGNGLRTASGPAQGPDHLRVEGCETITPLA
jgi:hypothetical protein